MSFELCLSVPQLAAQEVQRQPRTRRPVTQAQIELALIKFKQDFYAFLITGREFLEQRQCELTRQLNSLVFGVRAKWSNGQVKHFSFRLKLAGILIIGLVPSSCSRYSFSINDNLVYTPPGLFQAETVDPGLNNCLQQHIENQQITAAEQLAQLNCSSAGIVSLAGLERFSRIEALGLQDNLLTDISTLFLLSNLEFVDLRGNSLIPCEQLTRLSSLMNSASQMPSECLSEIP